MLRKLALIISNLSKADSDWIMMRLSIDEKAKINSLLVEVKELDLIYDEKLLSQLLADVLNEMACVDPTPIKVSNLNLDRFWVDYYNELAAVKHQSIEPGRETKNMPKNIEKILSEKMYLVPNE